LVLEKKAGENLAGLFVLIIHHSRDL